MVYLCYDNRSYTDTDDAIHDIDIAGVTFHAGWDFIWKSK